MASAVTVIFSADSLKFQAELKRMQAMTAAASANMSRGLSGGAGGGSAAGHGPVGMTGIIRESAVISREILMGRGLGRILGSMSLLTMYINSAANAHKGLDQSALASAEILKKEAEAAQITAVELGKKAMASAAVVSKLQDAKLASIDASNQSLSAATFAQKDVIQQRLLITQLENKIAAQAAATASGSALTAEESAGLEIDQIRLAVAKENIKAMEYKAAVGWEVFSQQAADTEGATANVVANQAVAATDAEVALAAEAYAVTLTEAAAAEHMVAMGAAEIEAATIPILPILIALALVILALYGSYKVIQAVIHQFTQRQIDAAKTAYDCQLNFEEEANALDKLEAAAKKADDALRKLDETHNTLAKSVEKSLSAWADFYAAQEKLANLKKDSALTQVDIDEKNGLITKQQAVEKKAAIEKQAIIDAAKATEDRLYAEKEGLQKAEEIANQQYAANKASADAASEKLNKSPEGMANAKELARLEKIEKDNRKEADKAEEDAMNLASGSKKKITQDNYAKTLNSIADIAHGRAQAQRDKMNPDEIAAGETMRAAQESKNAAEEIGDKHSEAVQKWLSNKTNSPAVVAAQLANIDLKAKDESLNKKEGSNGYSLNSQQRIGAYAATAPVLLQQLSVLHSIDRKVTPQHPPSNRPPGERPPQIGSNPQGARNWLHSH